MSPNRRECGACPVKLWPVWCHASMPGRGLLCDRLARPDYVAYVERRTLGGDSLAASISSQSARQIVAIETCDFRRSDCGCLSKPATCLQAGYPAAVGLDDCLSCVTFTDPNPTNQ